MEIRQRVRVFDTKAMDLFWMWMKKERMIGKMLRKKFCQILFLILLRIQKMC